MGVREDVKIALVMSKVSLTDVVKEIKKTKSVSLQSLNQKINRGTLRYSDAELIAKILGYKIKWIKSSAAIEGTKS